MPLDQTYLQVSDGLGNAALMHVSNTRAAAATTIEVDTVANVPTKFIATYGSLLASGFIDPATAVDFYGHLSGSDLEIDGFLPGSVDAGNAVGDVVVIRPNTFWANLIGDLLLELPGGNIEAATIGADQIKAVQTASLGATSWNNAIISSLATALRNGSATDGTKETFMAVDISGLAIPDNAIILQYHFWFNPASNTGAEGGCGAQVSTIVRTPGVHTISMFAQYGVDDATTPNLTNSKVQGYVRYITE